MFLYLHFYNVIFSGGFGGGRSDEVKRTKVTKGGRTDVRCFEIRFYYHHYRKIWWCYVVHKMILRKPCRCNFILFYTLATWDLHKTKNVGKNIAVEQHNISKERCTNSNCWLLTIPSYAIQSLWHAVPTQILLFFLTTSSYPHPSDGPQRRCSLFLQTAPDIGHPLKLNSLLPPFPLHTHKLKLT